MSENSQNEQNDIVSGKREQTIRGPEASDPPAAPPSKNVAPVAARVGPEANSPRLRKGPSVANEACQPPAGTTGRV